MFIKCALTMVRLLQQFFAEFVRLRLLPVDMNIPTLLFTPASLSSLMRSSSIGCCEQYSSMSLRYVSMRRRKLRRSSATASDTIRSLNTGLGEEKAKGREGDQG